MPCWPGCSQAVLGMLWGHGYPAPASNRELLEHTSCTGTFLCLKSMEGYSGDVYISKSWGHSWRGSVEQNSYLGHSSHIIGPLLQTTSGLILWSEHLSAAEGHLQPRFWFSFIQNKSGLLSNVKQNIVKGNNQNSKRGQSEGWIQQITSGLNWNAIVNLPLCTVKH